jgi:hypothetical protein
MKNVWLNATLCNFSLMTAATDILNIQVWPKGDIIIRLRHPIISALYTSYG